MLLATNQEKAINIMTIQKAINVLKSLKDQTTKGSEIKVYEEFIHILKRLDERGLSKGEIESIEEKLQDLNLEAAPRYRKRYFNCNLAKWRNRRYASRYKTSQTKRRSCIWRMQCGGVFYF